MKNVPVRNAEWIMAKLAAKSLKSLVSWNTIITCPRIPKIVSNMKVANCPLKVMIFCLLLFGGCQLRQFYQFPFFCYAHKGA